MQSWLDGLVGMHQKDIVLKTTTAVTGTQYFLLGSDHLPGWVAGEFDPELIPDHPQVIRPARKEKTNGGCLKVTPEHITDPISNPSILSRPGADFSPGHSPGAKPVVRKSVEE